MPQPQSPFRQDKVKLNMKSVHKMSHTEKIVGASVPRKEGHEKLLGRAHYVDDIELHGMWHGVTVRSTIPRGLIGRIRFSSANQLERVHGRNCCGYTGAEFYTTDFSGHALPGRWTCEPLR